MNETKPFYLSKTIWVNVLAVLASVLTSFGLEIGPELQASIVATGLGIANVVLRFVTKMPITVTKE